MSNVTDVSILDDHNAIRNSLTEIPFQVVFMVIGDLCNVVYINLKIYNIAALFRYAIQWRLLDVNEDPPK
jgi:hypothetical protein